MIDIETLCSRYQASRELTCNHLLQKNNKFSLYNYYFLLAQLRHIHTAIRCKAESFGLGKNYDLAYVLFLDSNITQDMLYIEKCIGKKNANSSLLVETKELADKISAIKQEEISELYDHLIIHGMQVFADNDSIRKQLQEKFKDLIPSYPSDSIATIGVSYHVRTFDKFAKKTFAQAIANLGAERELNLSNTYVLYQSVLIRAADVDNNPKRSYGTLFKVAGAAAATVAVYKYFVP